MKKIAIIIASSFFGFIAPAQHFEAGVLIGASNYTGDLSNNSNTIYLKETKPAIGLLAKYNINDLLAARIGFTYARVAGTDANVKRDEFVRERNLSFRSNLLEFSLIGEFNFLGYRPYGMYNPFSPYVFAGITMTKFNPHTRYEGNWVALQPLGTEGQGMSEFDSPYSLNTLAIPFGIGVKYALTDKINLGFEIGARRTFTDYLDDVSGSYVSYPELLAGNGELAAALGNRTGELKGGEPVIVPTGTQRGDKAKSDWYFMVGLTATYNFIDNGLMGSRGRLRSKAGCKN